MTVFDILRQDAALERVSRHEVVRQVYDQWGDEALVATHVHSGRSRVLRRHTDLHQVDPAAARQSVLEWGAAYASFPG